MGCFLTLGCRIFENPINVPFSPQGSAVSEIPPATIYQRIGEADFTVGLQIVHSEQLTVEGWWLTGSREQGLGVEGLFTARPPRRHTQRVDGTFNISYLYRKM